MIKFEFESHELTPEDPYIKEVVTFKFSCGTESFYMPYFHRTNKDGGSFWDVSATSIMKGGSKKYDDKFMFDSRMKDKQIRDFLINRTWEKKTTQPTQGAYYPHGLAVNNPAPTSMDEVLNEEVIPF